MAATHLTKTDTQAVARPIKVLVPLIKEDIANGRAAAERAGMPYYIAAGEKLLEAKDQIPRGEFQSWIKRTFHVSYETTRVWMRTAEANMGGRKTGAPVFASISESVREIGNPNYNRPSSWHEPVQKIVQSVDYEALRREDLKRAEERELERKLGLKLIDIGYKVLAQQMHPDKKEGSHESFARLKNVRDRLKNHV